MKNLYLPILPGALLLAPIFLLAQNRIIVNPSFETGAGIPHDGVAQLASQAAPMPQIDGWFSDHPVFMGVTTPIEHWRTGANSVPSQNGDYHVELNASEPSRLYQIVYLVNGEEIEYEFFHRSRGSGTEEVEFSVYDEAGANKIQVLGTNNDSDNTNWDQATGSANFAGPTGVYQIGFEAILPATGGSGNFLDNVTIALDGLTEFTRDTLIVSESSTLLKPFLFVNGEVPNGGTVNFDVQSTNAAAGTDYNFSSASVQIPNGDYSLADSVEIDFQVLDNEIKDGDRTVTLTIQSVSGDVDNLDANGDGYKQTLTIIILDNDYGPGDVGGAGLWFKADSLVETGGNFSWRNQMRVPDSDPSQSNASAQPGYSTTGQNLVNFNPSLTFDGNSDFLQTPDITILPDNGGTRSGSQFVVARKKGGGVIYQNCNTGCPWGVGAELSGKMWQSNTGRGTSLNNSVFLLDLVGTTSSSAIDLVGNLNGSGTGFTEDNRGFTHNDNRPLVIGKYQSGSFGNMDLAEIIIYPEAISAADRNKVQSYLALKYGISLGNGTDAVNYTASDGSTVFWTADDDYKSGIFGLGRDDSSRLEQQIATPAEGGLLVLSTDNNLTDANGTHAAISNDLNFLMVGHNGLQPIYDVDYSGTVSQNAVEHRMERVWQVQETGDLGPVFLKINDGIGKHLIISDDEIFDGTDTEITLNADGSTPAAVNLQNGQFFTFGHDVAGAEFLERELVIRESEVAKTPFLGLNGLESQASSATFSVIEETATSGTDFNFAGQPLDVPPMQYTLDSIAIPLTVIDDDIPEFNRSLKLVFESTTGDLAKADINGDGLVDTLTITIVDDDPCPNPGQDFVEPLCETVTSIDLTAAKFGTRDAGGQWLDPMGTPIGDPSNVDLTGLAIGDYVYTYQFSTSPRCGTPEATITVRIEEPFDPGPLQGTDRSFCIDQPVNLQALFPMADPGGTFDINILGVTTNGTIKIRDSIYDFSILTAVPEFDPAQPIFVLYYKDKGCGAGSPTTNFARAALTPSVPNSPGQDNSLTFCGGSAGVVDLFASLGGTPDPNGTWTDGSGMVISDPTQYDLSGLGRGQYEFTYTVTGPPPCLTPASASVFVNIDQSGNAGTGGSLQACKALDFSGYEAYGKFNREEPNAVVNLFDGLSDNPDMGGNWELASFPSGDPGDAFYDKPEAVDFSPVSLVAGTYEFLYIIPGDSGCSADTAMVTVTSTTAPLAGFPATELVCTGGGTTVVNFQRFMGAGGAGDLFDVNGAGVDLSDITAVDFAGVAEGAYGFQHVLQDPNGVCLNDTTLGLVKVNIPGNPGFARDTIVCTGSEPIFFLSTLQFGSPDPGGLWTSTSGTPVGQSSAVPIAGLAAGDYTFAYGFPPEGVCPPTRTEMTLTIADPPNTGTPDPIALCSDDSPLTVNLFDGLVSEDPGGDWSAFGNNVDISDPMAVDFQGQAAGQFFFQYNAPAACVIPGVLVPVQLSDPVVAGNDATVSVCNQGTTVVNFADAIGAGAQPGGIWKNVDGTGLSLTNPSAVDFDGEAPGTYEFRYVVPGSGGCDPDSAIVTVTVEARPDAGMATDTVTVCNSDAAYDLFGTLSGMPDLGGTWADDDNTGALSGNTLDVTQLILGETYSFTYTVAGSAVCSESSVTAIVEVDDLHDPDIAYDNQCANGFDLLPTSISTPGGTFSFVANPDMASLDPATGALSNYTEGTIYEVQYTTSDGVCQASGTATISPDTLPIVSVMVQEPVCGGDSTGIIDLNVSGVTDFQVSWNTGQMSERISGIPAGKYVYTLTKESCVVSKLVKVGEPLPVVIDTVLLLDPTCFGFEDGIILGEASGGTGDVGFGVLVEDQSFSYSAGEYVVFALDEQQCFALDTVELIDPPLLVISGTVTDATNGAGGAIDVTATGGTPPYLYMWDDGPATEDRIDLVPGDYALLLEDDNECMTTDTFLVDNIVSTTTIGELQVRVYPNPTTDRLRIELPGVFSYLLYDRTGAVVLKPQQGLDQADQDVSRLPAGVYLLEVRTEEGVGRMLIMKQ